MEMNLKEEGPSGHLSVEKSKREIVSVNVDDTVYEEETASEMVNSMKKNLSLYSGRDSSPVSIYKIPAKLRKVNEEAYGPRLVSIGPIHHGKPELQAMERFKWRFLDKYLKKTGFDLNSLAKAAMNIENLVRQCYQESFDNISNKVFSEMIMLDGIFLVILMAEYQSTPSEITSQRVPSTSHQISQNIWVRSDILHDIMLLENQLPFFVLDKYFQEYVPGDSQSLSHAIVEFFKNVGNVDISVTGNDRAGHLVDFIGSHYIPKYRKYDELEAIPKTSYTDIPTAAELHETGVKFKQGPKNNLMKVEFESRDGKLTIPKLKADEHTDTLFRNLIAFEQCEIGRRKDITSYVIFMRSLIKTPKDVDLLVNAGIIENFLGNQDQLVNLFNDLYNETVAGGNDFCLGRVSDKLNVYRRNYWHQQKAVWFRWKQTLRRDYFSNPWSTISVIAAVLLLILTALQTVFSVIS